LAHEAQVVVRLKRDPKLRRGPKSICKARGSVSADRAPADEDFVHALRRHPDRLSELVSGNPEALEVFALEDFTRMS